MERFKRSLSIRKKRDANTELRKPHQWQEDERKVREGSCSFQVKYLGCVEVFESRGIQICEEAVKSLKSKKSRSAWSRLSFRKKKRDSVQQSKGSHHRAILYVTGDALRVVDEISKGLIVDQTIEKVSFCAPDRNHDKGFAYICRDGTTRRWMCHGFLAVKESGERLSHAVGCAFAICLEKKQAREKEKVTVTYSENGTSFTRMGSFRQTTLTERLADPQSAIVAEPVPVRKVDNPYAVQRPHAPVDLLERQGSFRGFTRLVDSSPFKRNISLRLNELPSTLERQRLVSAGFVGPEQLNTTSVGTATGFTAILESDEQDLSPQSETPPSAAAAVMHTVAASVYNMSPACAVAGRAVASTGAHLSTCISSTPAQSLSPVVPQHADVGRLQVVAARQHMAISNPWLTGTSPAVAVGRVSDAEMWLNSTASQIDPFAAVPNVGIHRPRVVNGASSPHMATSITAVTVHCSNSVLTTALPAGADDPRATVSCNHDPFDSAFDSAWAAKSSGRSPAGLMTINPFDSSSVNKLKPEFEVKL